MTTPPVLRDIDHPLCSGEVCDQGAQVLRWQPAGTGPVLYVSTDVRVAPGEAIRAGIPICWPWFGPGRVAGLEPSHGFVRKTPWTLVDHSEDAGGETFHYRLTQAEASSPHFPHRYAVDLTARLGATLEVSLTTTNTGDEAFDYEEALHTYLVVGDITTTRLEGLDGVDYVDKVAGGEVRRQEGDVVFTGETDRVYASGGPVAVVDPTLGRRLVVTLDGASSCVVWNPWVEKARAAADIGDDDWERFVCVEGGNVFDNAVVLAPGEAHTTTYRLTVEDL